MMIPSIDLMNGKAVQLIEGKKKVLEEDDVFGLLERFSRFGETAVIDLDRALGTGDNRELVKQMCRQGECRVGGGLRTVEDAVEMIRAGASKIIVGSAAFTETGINTEFLESLINELPKSRIIVAADCVNGKIAVNGWKTVLDLPLEKVLETLASYCGGLLITTVEREGKMKGLNMELAERLGKTAEVPVTVAGGLSSLEELETLSQFGVDVQAGMALYTGEFSAEEGFAASLNFKNGLIPMITCDEQGQVLMLAYGNRESVQQTLETGKVTYFSRSRQSLWVKGETSGHVQNFINMKADCDRDALLIKAIQTGPACHQNRYSCFGDKDFSWGELEQVVTDRINNPVKGSYTASLDGQKVREKLAEESQELIDSYSRENMVWEAADLLYFMTVLLAQNGIKTSEVIGELERRRMA